MIDGTGLSASGSDIQGLINIVNQSYITISGFEIRNTLPATTTHSDWHMDHGLGHRHPDSEQ